MALCPRCNIPLVRRKGPHGMVYACPECGGRDVAIPVLRRLGATREFLNRIWSESRARRAHRMLRCPHCGQRMARIATQDGDHTLSLDVCALCGRVWFDGEELESVPKVPPEPRAEVPLSPRAREQLAIARIKLDLELQRTQELEVGYVPPEWWHWIPGLFGVPVEVDAPDRASRPYLTWGIAAVMFLVFLATAWDLPSVVEAWGFIPSAAYRHAGLTLVSSFFLHGGLMHLAGNLYFLLLFGDNVEEHIGRVWFVLLLFGSDLAGTMLHACYDPSSQVPLIGASAGISGVLGYYAVTYPWARLGVLFRFWVILRWLWMPAFVFIALFAFIQLVGALAQVSGFRDVSYLGHLGGLAVGIGAAVVVRVVRHRETAVALAE